MFKKLLSLFKKQKKQPQLYIYINEVTVLNSNKQIVNASIYTEKLSQRNKVALRRKLKQIYPDCTIKITGGYKTYLGKEFY